MEIAVVGSSSSSLTFFGALSGVGNVIGRRSVSFNVSSVVWRRTKKWRFVVYAAKKSKKDKKDIHSLISQPQEATGFFPEAVLLKKKVVKEDNQIGPEFADAEEEKLYQFLNLKLESDLKLERMRHYEVVYLIHEKHVSEVETVVSKVQGFIREKKGRIFRLNNWGMRRLAYKIRKASNANYILMNFELDAKCINNFKAMLDKDDRIIRHLVIKREEAITEDCPPPPEFHTLRPQGINYLDPSEIEDGDIGDENIIYVDEDGDVSENGVVEDDLLKTVT